MLLLAIAADQAGVGLGPCVEAAYRAGVFGLAGGFLPARGSGVAVARPVVVEDRRIRRKVGGACLLEASACLDDVRHLLAGLLAARLAGVGGDQANLPHLGGPFLVVVGGAAGL